VVCAITLTRKNKVRRYHYSKLKAFELRYAPTTCTITQENGQPKGKAYAIYYHKLVASCTCARYARGANDPGGRRECTGESVRRARPGMQLEPEMLEELASKRWWSERSGDLGPWRQRKAGASRGSSRRPPAGPGAPGRCFHYSSFLSFFPLCLR
jgi:hypothetical protein